MQRLRYLWLATLALSGWVHAERPVAVLMGYWPPTNEMLREWSADADRNPRGWQGGNWRGLGFDVYAYFPEFPPDGDPTNDQIGDVGSVGSEVSDLRVDYQDTSEDFWRIVDTHRPVVLITTSRGGDIAWELEALEGGHGGPTGLPAEDWISDRNGAGLPARSSIDPRSWALISRYRAGRQLASTLPLRALVREIAFLDRGTVQIDRATSGNYLSGFLGLHGLGYQARTPGVLMAGHIHVGRHVTVADARAMMTRTLEVVLEEAGRRALTR